MRHRIMVAKESERYDADMKQSTANFEDAVNITIDIDGVIKQDKQGGNENKK